MKYVVTVKAERPKKEGDNSTYRGEETLFEFCTENLDVHALAVEVVKNSSAAIAEAATRKAIAACQ